jgi:hypothetical protein
MANIIKGKVQDYNRTDKYDEDGYKYIAYWIRVNGQKYTLETPEKKSFYFGNQMDVILETDENNVAIAGVCPKNGYSWGKTKFIESQIKSIDRFELAKGKVIEKRREDFNLSTGTFSTAFNSTFKNVTTFTIVLPEKTFRVADIIGEKIKPNTEIVALLENDVAYIIKDLTNNKTYGKPRQDYLIAIFLLLAFNIAVFYYKTIFINFNTLLLVGNIFFGIAFLISFSSFLSKNKTMRDFKEMLKL